MNEEAEGSGVGRPCRHELEACRREWCWFAVLGITLMILGAASIGASFFVSVVTVVLFGVLLLAAGIAQLVSAFWAGKWGGFFLDVLLGIFYIVVGILIIDAPVESAVALTLLLAAFFIVAGIFRIISALVIRFPSWPWALLSGIVAVLLGVLIYKQWPASGLWVIGLFVGIELIFNGWHWLMLGLDVHRIPLPGAEQPQEPPQEPPQEQPQGQPAPEG